MHFLSKTLFFQKKSHGKRIKKNFNLHFMSSEHIHSYAFHILRKQARKSNIIY